MEDQIIKYFSRFMSLTAAEAEAIRDSICIRTFEKGTVLLKEGQISRECYFILKGCIRKYYIINGEEKTADFFTEEQWVASLSSFAEKKPANHYFSCVEDTILVVGNEAKEQDLYRRFPKFESLSRTVLEKDFAKQQETAASYITDTPEQRYLNLLKNNPGLIERVPQYQLASYIGIQPESLSRIRKRLSLKKTIST